MEQIPWEITVIVHNMVAAYPRYPLSLFLWPAYSELFEGKTAIPTLGMQDTSRFSWTQCWRPLVYFYR